MKDFGELGVLSSIQLPLSDGVVSHHLTAIHFANTTITVIVNYFYS